MAPSTVVEALRARVLVDALAEPVSLRLVLWYAIDESPFAPREQAWADARATVRSLIADELVSLEEQAAGGGWTAVAQDRLEAVLEAVTERVARGDRPAWTGPWLTLTADGERAAAQLVPCDGRPGPRRRRRLHAAVAGHSGHRDSSERVDEILANEVWK